MQNIIFYKYFILKLNAIAKNLIYDIKSNAVLVPSINILFQAHLKVENNQ
jgi:hypothetical protein